MEAGGGQCPFAQVLRNSLSGHRCRPATRHYRKRISLRKRREAELRPRIAQHLSGRVRPPSASMWLSAMISLPLIIVNLRRVPFVLWLEIAVRMTYGNYAERLNVLRKSQGFSYYIILHSCCIRPQLWQLSVIVLCLSWNPRINHKFIVTIISFMHADQSIDHF